MATPSQLVMTQAATESFESSPDSLVMAWATDSETGAPVYILALDKSRATSKCRCICPSCSLPLTAVNVGKIKYQRRPNFRHPKGAAKSECMFLSARLAALHLLQRSGYIKHDDAVIVAEVEFMFELTSSFMKHLIRLSKPTG